MKKKLIVIGSIVGIVIIAAIVFIISRLTISYPEETEIGNYGYCITDEGMYYAKYNKLYFLDGESGQSAVLCSKANCNHDSNDCYAYVESIQPELMYYDGYVYVASNTSNIEHKDGESTYTADVNLYAIKKDGSERYNIYNSDQGAVSNMKAVNGYIYYTAWVFHDEISIDKYLLDLSLYRYDLRWKKQERLYTFGPEESQQTAALKMVNGNSENIYFEHEVIYDDGTKKECLYEYRDGKVKELAQYENAKDVNYIINDDKQYMIYNVYGENDIEYYTIYESEDFFEHKQELFKVEDGWTDIMDGYFMHIQSDYNKILYDCYTGKLYIANTSFTEEGTYISDIYDIDRDRNRIYINTTDYTGILPGTLFTEDSSNRGVCEFDIFLNEYFTDVDDIEKESIEKLDWIISIRQ